MNSPPPIYGLRRQERIKFWIELIGFWCVVSLSLSLLFTYHAISTLCRLLGLCNNFGYVVMLSAAHDILKQEEHQNSTKPETNGTTNQFDCNPMSTGVRRRDLIFLS